MPTYLVHVPLLATYDKPHVGPEIDESVSPQSLGQHKSLVWPQPHHVTFIWEQLGLGPQ